MTEATIMTDGVDWTIGVVQMDCVPGDRQANLDKIESFAVAAGRQGVQLLVLPECATTGYFVAPRLETLAETADGATADALAGIARANGLHLAVGIITTEGGRYFDSQWLFSPEGKLLAEYRKVHLFAAERQWFAAGDRPMVVDTDLGRIGLTICYDLVFPDYVRRLTELGADLIVNSTNWIADAYQRETWGWSGATTQGLATTRALENVTFLAMANRTGREEGFDSLGHSCIAGPSGRLLASVQTGEGMAVARIAIAGEDLARWRGIATYRDDRRPELYR